MVLHDLYHAWLQSSINLLVMLPLTVIYRRGFSAIMELRNIGKLKFIN